MSLFSEIEKIDDSNDNEWQPAIVLPASYMCDFHKEVYAAMPEDIKNFRQSYVGKRIWVRFTTHPSYVIRGDGSKLWLPKGTCMNLQFKVNKEGKKAGCFSCEVSTD